MAGFGTNDGPVEILQEDIPIGTINEEAILDEDNAEVPFGEAADEEPAIQFSEEDLKEARERAELSLLARIFWDEPRELRLVENSFIQVWKCGRVRVFDVGFGLYQFIFPTVSKREWVLDNQPWFFQRSIIHFTANMSPSEDLFHSLQFMSIWVKIIGLPFSYITIAVGRKLLAKLGEVEKVGYYDAGTPEGCYIKGRVRMDLLGSFRGTAPVIGHVMADCPRTDLVFDENVRSDWISGKADPNEKESQGPQLQPIPFVPSPHDRGRGGLPPSVAARLSSKLQRQWARDRQTGGARGHAGRWPGGPWPILALPGPGPTQNWGAGRPTRGPGPSGHRPPLIRPLQILAPRHVDSGRGSARAGSSQVQLDRTQPRTVAQASSASYGLGSARQGGPAAQLPARAPFQTGSAQLRPSFSPQTSAVGPVGPVRASSAPLISIRPSAAGGARRSAPLIQAHDTPQSKHQVGAAPGSSRRSTPSSGSVKRKLLDAFDVADGPDLSHHIGPAANDPEEQCAGGGAAAIGPVLARPPERVPISEPWSPFTPVAMFINHG
ncbi:hypothetical protein LINPERHAP2_LOCUS37447 [Linum perenne]